MSTSTIITAAQLTSLIQSHLEESLTQQKIPLLAVIGPTASGKTALGIALARAYHGEIISADSRQVYREMNVGTAKPTLEERAGIPHHLLDCVNPDQIFTLADFQKLANEQIQKIHQAGHLPILVGGTGLYVSAITQNYHLPAATPDLNLRQKYEQLAREQGNEAVHQVLRRLDPQAAHDIHPGNLRYVIRAIEIAMATDAPKQAQKGHSPYHTLYLQVDWPREELYQRIEARIDHQLATGLVEETEALLQKYGRDLPALTSLGYGEIGDFLQGEISLSEATNLFKQKTRNYAKRQLTWFRKFPQVYSIPGNNLKVIL